MRRSAVEELGKLRDHAAVVTDEVLPVLMKQLEHDLPGVRSSAAQALCRIPPTCSMKKRLGALTTFYQQNIGGAAT